MPDLTLQFNEGKNEKWLFFVWASISALCIGAGVWKDNVLFGLIPFALAFAWWVCIDYRNIYYLFFFLLPFSIEYNFTPSLGTDLPSEPIMMVMTGIGILLFSYRFSAKSFSKYFNAITYLLLFHLAWIFVTSVLSDFPVLSFKIFAAKLWYLIPFYFLSMHILVSHHEVGKMIKSGIFTLAIAIVIVLIRHGARDFAFEEANFVVTPIFRNHVNYACIIVIFLPYLWTLFSWEKLVGMKILYALMIVLYATGIYFSYTRAAILSMALSVVIYFVIKAKLMRPALAMTALLVTIGLSYLLYNNNYLRLNPDYEKTITHQRFDKLITATYKMEDISTMERVYRWVAGVEMIKDKPIFGFGPGTFYSAYKAYTLSSFQTYVSDNPDHSTVHNYFLLTFIEQGAIGFIIFIALVVLVLVIGEDTYHKTKDKKDKAVVMAAMLSFCIILLLNMINDMIETDKVGPFFFLSMALIASYYHKVKIEEKQVIKS